MKKKENAVRLFKLRLNCSQAIFSAYQDELDERTALKLATVFGAGVAGTGQELCGAVTGALMALSLKYGRADLESVDAKTKTHEMGRQFLSQFKAKHGSCVCEQLLGMNIGTAEGHKKAQEAGLFETQCLDVVKSAADILDELL
jgi:C_GCAxxG_C_C family probable redox protein